MKDYSVYSDEELAVLYKNGDKDSSEELIRRYKKTVKSIARCYYLSGGEEDDLVQEGTIGLFGAIIGYDGSSVFKNYALTCIKREIISAIRKHTGNKNKPLNYYIPLNVEDGDDKSPISKSEVVDPEEELINSENAKELLVKIKDSLSEYEYKILQLYAQGYSYADLAEKINSGEKSVDNAIQRIKKKIAKVIAEEK